MKAKACEVPPFSVLQSSLSTADFFDCYAVELPPDGRSPLELYLNVVARTPRWVDFLMGVRNQVVARLGLKHMGALSRIDPGKPAQAYRVGDRAGIFKLLALHDSEVILGEFDKHLDVRISVAKQDSPGKTTVSVSTVVHVHNTLGHVYMFFVGPAHRVIAPVTVSMLDAPARA